MVIQGARSNDRRMRAIGFPTFRYKLVCFVIAGVMCGLAGVLLANHTEFISPAIMHWTRSGDLIVMVVLGGMGSMFGPLIGAVALLVLEEALPALIELSAHPFTRRGRGAARGILAARARAAVAAGRAVRARRHRRTVREACAVAEALLRIEGLTKRFGGVVASDGDHARRPGGRTARHHRPERRRQDHADRPIVRRDRRPMPAASGSTATTSPALPAYAAAACSGSRARSRSPRCFAISPRSTTSALAVQAHAGHSFRFWRDARSEAELREPARAALARVGLDGARRLRSSPA